jgi:tetratricopeptide (TPR) repeat protein
MLQQSPHHVPMQLNNRGAFFLETRRYENAIACLGEALQDCKRGFRQNGQNPHRKFASSSASLDQLIKYYPEHVRRPHPEIDDHDSNDFVYSRPMYIPARTLHAEIQEYNFVVSVAILFNLALAHHLLALENELDRDKLQKALSLYKIAYELQLDESLEGNTFFVMATFNNLGQIHKTLKERDTAYRCFQHLLSTLIFSIDNGSCQISEIDVFFRSAFDMMFDSSSAAAA